MFYTRMGLSLTIAATFTALVYARENTVIYFWECTSSVRECNLMMGTIFFFIVAIVVMIIFSFRDIWHFVTNQFFKKNTITLIPINNINVSSVSNIPFSLSSAVGIEIHNNNLFEVSECTATLESLQRVFIEKGKIKLDGKGWSKLGIGTKKELRWIDKDFNGSNCKVLIKPNSKENTILIAGIFNRVKIEKKKKSTNEINKFFSFTFCEPSPEQMIATGLFKVKVRVNGKGFENSVVVKEFENYIYSYPEDEMVFDVFWVENPLKNQRILHDPRVVRG